MTHVKGTATALATGAGVGAAEYIDIGLQCMWTQQLEQKPQGLHLAGQSATRSMTMKKK